MLLLLLLLLGVRSNDDDDDDDDDVLGKRRLSFGGTIVIADDDATLGFECQKKLSKFVTTGIMPKLPPSRWTSSAEAAFASGAGTTVAAAGRARPCPLNEKLSDRTAPG